VPKAVAGLLTANGNGALSLTYDENYCRAPIPSPMRQGRTVWPVMAGHRLRSEDTASLPTW